MTTKKEALKMALEAICGSGEFLFNWHDCEPNNEREIQQYQAVLAANEKAFTALRRALEQPAPPPECKTDAEKTAYAFGWFKALEANREQPSYRAVKTFHEGKPVYVAEQPAERPEPPHCMVGGLIKDNAMCGHVIQMKFCGYGGPCQYKGDQK